MPELVARDVTSTAFQVHPGADLEFDSTTKPSRYAGTWRHWSLYLMIQTTIRYCYCFLESRVTFGHAWS